ncbi:MAG: cytochrome c [Pseudomonadales bacterium]
MSRAKRMTARNRLRALAAVFAGAALLGPAAALADDSGALSTTSYALVPPQFIYCTTCHGVELKGNISVDAPRLSGMADWYVRAQLQAFKAGRRGTHPEDLIGMEMQPQAAVLSDKDLEAAARFVASLPARTDAAEQTVAGDAARGKALYATCAACHGAEGRGSQVLGAPALTGQSDWYLLRQLEKYASGARGYDPADTPGQQMRASVAVLTGEQDAADVVAYINTLDNQGDTP